MKFPKLSTALHAFSALAFAAATTACAISPTATAPSPSSSTPNIIVILADDVGYGDTSAYGATQVSTPNLDRLAREGRRFEHGYASASSCTPTRYAMLTGQYSWRSDRIGVNCGVAQGDSPLVIPTDMPTAPGLLQQAGYRTAVIGKWHLGFDDTKPDFNQELRPGPLEVGFHEYFGFPSTNDRIPTVYIRDRHVLNLDPADPLLYSYNKAEAEAAGMTPWAAGRNRIGWSKGGKSAWWTDATMTDVHLRETLAFLERNQASKFFLYFAPHNVHAPTVPGPRFAGRSGLGNRADTLLELDDSIGQLLDALDRLQLAENTLIIFSSDNGAYVVDEQGHRPNGPFRGTKSQLWEGGLRVPFIVRWPARISPGVSPDLVSTLDIPATVIAAAGLTPPADALPDSLNFLPRLLDASSVPPRDFLVLQSGAGRLAARAGHWKYIPDLDYADGWKARAKVPGSAARPALFDLAADPGETTNLVKQHPAEAERIAALMAAAAATPRTRP